MAYRKSTRVNEPMLGENSQEFVAQEIDQKIDEFIGKYPKRFKYHISLAKECLARAAILEDIRAQERFERTRSAILRKLDSDPERKKSVETLVRNLPEDVKRTAMATIASRTFQRRSRRSREKPAEGVGSVAAGP